MHNARLPGGLSPPHLEGDEYGAVVRLTLRQADSQHQAALRCPCHNIFGVAVAGDLTGLTFSAQIDFPGLLHLEPAYTSATSVFLRLL